MGSRKEEIVSWIVRESGVREVVGGEFDGRPPHVFADVSNEQPVASEEDALRIANDTEYGLTSAAFTSDLERGARFARFARRIQAGMAHVNDQPVNDSPSNPFGGEKNSGIGRFNSQWVTVQHAPRSYPF